MHANNTPHTTHYSTAVQVVVTHRYAAIHQQRRGRRRLLASKQCWVENTLKKLALEMFHEEVNAFVSAQGHTMHLGE